MIMNINTIPSKTSEPKRAAYAKYTGSVTYNDSPGTGGVWCECPGKEPLAIIGYYKGNDGKSRIFVDDIINESFQQSNITTVDTSHPNTFCSAPEAGETYNKLGRETAGVQTGYVPGTAGTCHYMLLYMYEETVT